MPFQIDFACLCVRRVAISAHHICAPDFSFDDVTKMEFVVCKREACTEQIIDIGTVKSLLEWRLFPMPYSFSNQELPIRYLSLLLTTTTIIIRIIIIVSNNTN